MQPKRMATEGIVVHRAEVTTPTDYHYLVARDGTLSAIVPLELKAEHAKEYNNVSIGVAIFGDFAAFEPGKNNVPTGAQLDTTIALLRTLNALYGNKLWCAGHSQLGTKGTDVPAKLTYGHTCPGENFALSMVIQKAGLRPFLPVVA